MTDLSHALNISKYTKVSYLGCQEGIFRFDHQIEKFNDEGKLVHIKKPPKTK